MKKIFNKKKCFIYIFLFYILIKNRIINSENIKKKKKIIN